MGINLTKPGESINLSKESGGTLVKARVGLGWVGKGGRRLDLDSFVAVLDKDQKVIDFIYFGHKTSQGVKHNGDDLVGGGSATSVNETIDIDLTQVPMNAQTLLAGVFIYSGASSLNEVDSAFMNVVNSNGNAELVRYNISEAFGKSKSVVIGKLVGNSDHSQWKFIAVGEASNDGYSEVCNRYAVNSIAPQQPLPQGLGAPAPAPSRGGFFGRIFG